jgi:hypothetical protein
MTALIFRTVSAENESCLKILVNLPLRHPERSEGSHFLMLF